MNRRVVSDGLFWAFFGLFTGGVVLWLAIGLAPAIVHYIPSLRDMFGSRVALASETVDSSTRIGLEAALSLLNLLLAILLVRLRPKDIAARLIAIGMIGTAATFNHQSHAVLKFELIGNQEDLHTLFHLASGLAYMLAVVVFPDGRIVPFVRRPARRSLLTCAYGAGLAIIAAAVLVAIPESHPGQRFFTLLFGVLVPVVGLAAQTYRRRRTVDVVLRQQSRLLQWALLPMLAGGLLYAASGPGGPQEVGDLGLAVFPALFALIPIALMVGILRYRLWDIDVLLTKTLISVGLAALIGVTYVGIVVVLGDLIGAAAPVAGLEILATALAAVAFEPAREGLQRVANRLVYGNRATPYEVMAGFGSRLAGAISVEEVLPRMAEAAARAVSGAASEVTVRLPGGGSRSVAWPDAEPRRGGEQLTAPVRYRGEAIGEVSVTKHVGERASADDYRLVETLATQAGLAINNARLALELADKLEELSRQAVDLRASRARILTAREALRQRVVKTIGERVETRLAAVGGRLDDLEAALVGDPSLAAPLLESLSADAGAALAALRELARGLFPAILTDQGLVPALEAHLAKTGMAAAIRGDGAARDRFPAQAEATLFFGITECLARGACSWVGPVQVELVAGDDRFGFTVSGRPSRRRRRPRTAANGSLVPARALVPAAGPDDLQDVCDRLEAVGGQFEASYDQAAGSVALSGWAPARRPAQPG